MIDKRLLIDELQVKLVKDKGDYGGFVYDGPFTLSPVRFDRNLATAGKDNARQETKPSVIFIYPKYCKTVHGLMLLSLMVILSTPLIK